MTKLFVQPKGSSPITEEQRRGLLQGWVSTQEELNLVEQTNILEGRNWLFNSNRLREDYTHLNFISQLHKKMLGKVYSWAGKIRTTETYLGLDPYLIVPEFENLRRDFQVWQENEVYTKDERAIRYHYRLVVIHPFLNGNGRLSRFMSDFLNEQIFEKGQFTWGGGNLANAGQARNEYIASLKRADNHEIEPLIEFARS